MSDKLELREAANVADLVARDKLVRRIKRMREEAEIDKATYEHWNSLHPDDVPVSTAFEDAMIAWCDGKGPPPGLR